MDATEAGFQRRWKQQFPGVESPRLGGLSDSKSVQQRLNESEKRVSNLKEQLRREEFLKDYLWNLHRRCPNVDKAGGGGGGGGGHSGLITANLKKYCPSNDERCELDTPSPVDSDPFDDNKGGIHKPLGESSSSAGSVRDRGHVAGISRRDRQGSARAERGAWRGPPTSAPTLPTAAAADVSESSVPDGMFTFTPGITGAGCLTGKPDSGSSSMRGFLNNRLGLGRVRKDGVVSDEDGGDKTATKKGGFKVTRPAPDPPKVCSSPKSEKRNTVGVVLPHGVVNNNNNELSRAPLSKSSSVDLNSRNTPARSSQRNRPPVPLPRPTVKGPTHIGHDPTSSPVLERKLSSNSSSIDNQMDSRDNSPCPARRRRPYHNYCEIEISGMGGGLGVGTQVLDSFESGSSTEDHAQDGNPNSAAPPLITASMRRRQQRSQDYMNVTIPKDSDTPVFPPSPVTTRVLPPMLQPRAPKIEMGQADSGGSGASVGSREDEDAIRPYDNPLDCLARAGMVVHAADQEEGSSSDEDNEPIYFNIMQLKQQMREIQQSSAIYASISVDKKGGDGKDGKKGMVPTSPLLTDTIEGPPVPHRTDSVKANANRKPLTSADSVESIDAVFSDTPLRPKEDGFRKKRGSMRAALAEPDDSRSVSSVSDEGESQIVRTVETEKLHMRKWVMTSILDSEHSYIDMLDVLLQYMRSLEASAKSSQPVITQEEVATIFFKIPDLHRIHSTFVSELEPIVEQWANDSTVGAVFKILALEEYPLSNDYCQNYAKATACLQRCSEENTQFHELVQAIKCNRTQEVATLEEMLHKPVVRVQRNTLVLHDLIKFTPTSHIDFDMLQKTLKITQNFLDNFQTPTDPEHSENQRYLVKNGMIVEMVNNRRKVRHVFLFNDVLVCARPKLSRQKTHFECKLFIPLTELLIEASQSKEDSKMAAGQRNKVEKLKKRVSELQVELRAELKKNQGQAEGRQWSMRGGRNMEKIRKKLTEQEVELFRESPNLVFRLRSNNKKCKLLTLLMSSDYERTDWRESITGLQIKHTQGASTHGLTVVDLQNLINSVQRPNMHIGASADVAMEEEHVYGSLCVTVHRIQGLKAKADTFCCIEVDSYSHFFMKAKTNIIASSSEPQWNEEFEIDLDGAQTLRMLAYRMQGDSDTLLGRGALELSKTWLKGRYQETTVSLNEELSLTLSLKYTSREQTLKRTPSSAKGGLFGVKISSVTNRESRQVPLIVSTIVEEVEKRGLDDLGIYRISGLSSEIQRLKKAFERNVRGATPLARETDTHVLACLLKLYFRELPEALFTDKLYPSFVEGLNMSDPEAKQRCMMSILRSLPEPNYTTIVYLLNHMVIISKNEAVNKMSINNLATVFGPTLLRPALQDDEPVTLDLFSLGARDAMLQTGILFYFLTLKNAGGDFTKNLS